MMLLSDRSSDTAFRQQDVTFHLKIILCRRSLKVGICYIQLICYEIRFLNLIDNCLYYFIFDN